MKRAIVVTVVAAVLLLGGCAEPPPDPPDTAGIEAEPLVEQRILEATDAVRAEPSSAEAWGRLGAIYDIHRFGEQALECYAQASEMNPDEWVWPYFSGVILRDNDQAGAATEFERAIELKPDYPPIHLYVGAAYLLLEDLDRSEEHFRRAMELDPASINARIGLGRVALARGQADKAVTLLEEATRLAPREAASHHNLAQIYRAVGRNEDADREQRIAELSPVRMQPGDMASFRDPVRDEVTMREGVSSMWLLENSRRLMAEGQEAQAFEFLEKALDADPDSEIALLGTARILFNRGDLSQARQRVERALDIDERSAAAHVEMGNLLARSGDLEGAIREFEIAIEIDPETAEAQNNLAALLFEGGRPEEGLNRLREAARALPGETNIQFNLAVALQRRNEYDEAIEVLRSMLEISPDHTSALHMLGFVLASREQFDEAVGLFARVVQLQPGNQAARLDLGRAAWELGRYAEAVAAYRDARRIAPDNVEVGRELAWALATCPQDDVRDGSQALALARTLAEKTEYRDARLLDVLAAAQAETGDYPGAASTARRSIMIVERLLESRGGERSAETAAMQSFLTQVRKRAALYQDGRPYREPS
jgi:tetratricopeptide (TPR) repeat protein